MTETESVSKLLSECCNGKTFDVKKFLSKIDPHSFEQKRKYIMGEKS